MAKKTGELQAILGRDEIIQLIMYRVSYRGALDFPPPPATIFPTRKLNVVCVIKIIRNFVPDCVRSNLRGMYINSKFSWGGGGGGACLQTPLVSMHVFYTLLSSCYDPVPPPPPPTQILYETPMYVASTNLLIGIYIF